MTGSEVRSYARLRENLAKRDRSLREKVMSLHDAATLVQDGMSVGVGGSTMSRTPMAMIWELMRQRRKHLSCSRSIVSTDGDLLFGSDMADEVVTSWFAQGILWGLSKVMRHHVEKGSKRFQEWSHMAMGMRFRAGGMGVPFLPIRSMLGSDVLKQRPEAKAFDCPFTGEKLLLVPALNPDVALIHVQRCDPFGNAQRLRSSTALSPGRNCCSSRRSTRTLRSFMCSAATLLATPRSTACSSWTSISPWPPIG